MARALYQLRLKPPTSTVSRAYHINRNTFSTTSNFQNKFKMQALTDFVREPSRNKDKKSRGKAVHIPFDDKPKSIVQTIPKHALATAPARVPSATPALSLADNLKPVVKHLIDTTAGAKKAPSTKAPTGPKKPETSQGQHSNYTSAVKRAGRGVTKEVGQGKASLGGIPTGPKKDNSGHKLDYASAAKKAIPNAMKTASQQGLFTQVASSAQHASSKPHKQGATPVKQEENSSDTKQDGPSDTTIAVFPQQKKLIIYEDVPAGMLSASTHDNLCANLRIVTPAIGTGDGTAETLSTGSSSTAENGKPTVKALTIKTTNAIVRNEVKSTGKSKDKEAIGQKVEFTTAAKDKAVGSPSALPTKKDQGRVAFSPTSPIPAQAVTAGADHTAVPVTAKAVKSAVKSELPMTENAAVDKKVSKSIAAVGKAGDVLVTRNDRAASVDTEEQTAPGITDKRKKNKKAGASAARKAKRAALTAEKARNAMEQDRAAEIEAGRQAHKLRLAEAEKKFGPVHTISFEPQETTQQMANWTRIHQRKVTRPRSKWPPKQADTKQSGDSDIKTLDSTKKIDTKQFGTSSFLFGGSSAPSKMKTAFTFRARTKDIRRPQVKAKGVRKNLAINKVGVLNVLAGLHGWLFGQFSSVISWRLSIWATRESTLLRITGQYLAATATLGEPVVILSIIQSSGSILGHSVHRLGLSQIGLKKNHVAGEDCALVIYKKHAQSALPKTKAPREDVSIGQNVFLKAMLPYLTNDPADGVQYHTAFVVFRQVGVHIVYHDRAIAFRGMPMHLEGSTQTPSVHSIALQAKEEGSGGSFTDGPSSDQLTSAWKMVEPVGKTDQETTNLVPTKFHEGSSEMDEDTSGDNSPPSTTPSSPPIIRHRSDVEWPLEFQNDWPEDDEVLEVPYSTNAAVSNQPKTDVAVEDNDEARDEQMGISGNLAIMAHHKKIGTVSLTEFFDTLDSTSSEKTHKLDLAAAWVKLSTQERARMGMEPIGGTEDTSTVLKNKLVLYMVNIGSIKLGEFLELMDFDEDGFAIEDRVFDAFEAAAQKDMEMNKRAIRLARIGRRRGMM
ncbi:hypothetical protein BDV95DRAFT_604315 [Massariosphaeria phaeospora]|uniref:Uncharacterized protein n=1 Tax=Massariosphaeria phaeospora TaxID=100035 RepID=A0A7C8ID59_9PLEO|nr:hypothetical protein BDV95DRAFT_604315 [Massariosphaeria phaeospora]